MSATAQRRHSPSNEWCRRADSQIGVSAPIGAVVDRPAAGQGVVRDFVVLESGVAERAVHREELLFARLFRHGGEPALRHAAAEGRLRLYGQMVCRNVLHAQRDRFAQIACERRGAESGYAEDQVDGHVAEARLLRLSHGLARRVGRMGGGSSGAAPRRRTTVRRSRGGRPACGPAAAGSRASGRPGLASTVHSSRTVQSKSSAAWAMNSSNSSGGSSEGVPPPK